MLEEESHLRAKALDKRDPSQLNVLPINFLFDHHVQIFPIRKRMNKGVQGVSESEEAINRNANIMKSQGLEEPTTLLSQGACRSNLL